MKGYVDHQGDPIHHHLLGLPDSESHKIPDTEDPNTSANSNHLAPEQQPET